MKISVFAFLVLSCAGNKALAQDLYLISAGGTHSSGAGGSVSWSVGEVVTTTATSSDNHVTQGFHQGNIYVVGLEQLAEISVAVFPNPTRETVTIQISEPVTVAIYDMSGRLVGTYEFTEPQNFIDITSFSRGTYNMIFERKGSETRNVKLVVL